MNKSFTIIELLVVITIIGILSSILVISITEAINSANDAKKEATINQIAKALTLYHVDNNSYPAMSCRIGDSGCLDFLVPQYISTLPDYETYNYAYSSVNGNEFAIMTIGSKKIINYTDKNGFNESIVAISRDYGFLNMLHNSVNTIQVDDYENGALWGKTASFSAGWAGDVWMTHPSQDYGFTPGTYAIYVRIRTNGLGNYPHRARFGIYNSDTKIEKAKIINDLTTSYQLRYVMNYTVDEININERVRCYFNEAIYTTQYYVDYVEFRKIN